MYILAIMAFSLLTSVSSAQDTGTKITSEVAGPAAVSGTDKTTQTNSNEVRIATYRMVATASKTIEEAKQVLAGIKQVTAEDKQFLAVGLKAARLAWTNVDEIQKLYERLLGTDMESAALEMWYGSAADLLQVSNLFKMQTELIAQQSVLTEE